MTMRTVRTICTRGQWDNENCGRSIFIDCFEARARARGTAVTDLSSLINLEFPSRSITDSLIAERYTISIDVNRYSRDDDDDDETPSFLDLTDFRDVAMRLR